MMPLRGAVGAEPTTLEDVSHTSGEPDGSLHPYAAAVVETIRESLLVLDDNLRVRTANRAFFETFQVSPEETQGRFIGELGNGQWNIPRLRFLLESLRSSIEEFKNFEVDHYFPNIGRRTMLLNARRLIQETNGASLILLAIEDTTERKRMEENLRDSEERFRQLAENIQVAFWMTDVKRSKMIYVSPGYDVIWGRRREELYLSPLAFFDSIHPEDRDRVMRAALAKSARGKYKEEFRILRPDGTIRWVRDRAFPVKDESGKVYRIAGIAEDITELKRAENLILDISGREQRRIGQDMHDGVCQSLTGIKFMSKVLEEKLSSRGMAEANDASEIGKLVSQALTQADVAAKGLCPVELEANGLLPALQQLAAGFVRVHNIHCQVRASEPVEVADQAIALHAFRIAQEALSNAVKHGQAANITIGVTRTDDRIILTIEDDGIGLNRVAKRKGMGMHIMRFRARKMGASLAWHRRPEGGTVVTCTFQNAVRKSKFGRRRDDSILI